MSIILFALLAHFVGDFLLQPREMAQKKSSDWTALVMHCGIVCFAMIPVGMLVAGPLGISLANVMAFAIFNAILHGVIDRNIWKRYKVRALKRGKKFAWWNDQVFYLVIGFDQFLHVSTMFFLLWWMVG